MNLEISAEASYVLQFINQTNKNIFLTGKAGTGKTTLLKEIIRTTYKNTVVVAPTGIAALNAGGVTIHSMFQLPFAGFIPRDMEVPHVSDYFRFETKRTLGRHFQMNAIKKSVIRNMELLIVDEVSMLRPDVLDSMNFMLQRVRRNQKPFGGVQVLFIGDLLQLPPIIKAEEWAVLSQYYSGKYFFNSEILTSFSPLYIELSKIFRQEDPLFIDILNHLRTNVLTEDDIHVLNKYYDPSFDIRYNTGYITLTTHNQKADAINTQSLKELETQSYIYTAEVVDDFPEKIYPLEAILELKVGAQVMFIKNDLSQEKRYFNGKMGIIQSLSEREIVVRFEEERESISVDKYEWENKRYYVDDLTKEIKEEILGTYTQYPLKLAWAITVHKSQGLTFDRAALDIGQVFEAGQAYVAFSRLRSLNGLVLLHPIEDKKLNIDPEVIHYASNKADESQIVTELNIETKKYVLECLKNSFSFQKMIREWEFHCKSYFQETELSIKSQSKSWANEQLQLCKSLSDSSTKFQVQLEALFHTIPLDLEFISQRVEAAFNYYYEKLHAVNYNILYKLESVIRAKRAKQFYNDLKELEEIHIQAMMQLFKSKTLITTLKNQLPFTKENLVTSEMSLYKTKLVNRVREDFKSSGQELIEDDAHLNRYSKKTEKKEPKVNTYELTLQLWNEHKNIEKIKDIRKLTENTILGHFGKLIEMKKVEIHEVVADEKLELMKEVLQKATKEMPLNELKSMGGDIISWEEVKLYKSYLMSLEE